MRVWSGWQLRPPEQQATVSAEVILRTIAAILDPRQDGFPDTRSDQPEPVLRQLHDLPGGQAARHNAAALPAGRTPTRRRH